ncbi:MAG: hypothetical protein ABI024_07685 [Vicinamibacterales bacterium]
MAIQEFHSDRYCLHPYYGFVCTPGATIDFSDTVPAHFRHRAVAQIDGEGFRNSPRPFDRPADEFWIGLFGGSVAFSAPASSNDRTIAGQLARQLAATPLDNRRVRVVDFSLPAGQQPQQLAICTLGLHNLDAAVTFDGVNEVVIPSFYNTPVLPSAFPYRPIYEVLYGQGISDEQRAIAWLRADLITRFEKRPRWRQALTQFRHDAELERLTARLRNTSGTPGFTSMFPVAETSATVALSKGADNWQSCIQRMESLCSANGVRTMFAIQPIPDRQKVLTNREQGYMELHPEVVALRRDGYSLILERAQALKERNLPVVSFEDVFAARQDDIYTDLIHFEDQGCGEVATRMASWILERWR